MHLLSRRGRIVWFLLTSLGVGVFALVQYARRSPVNEVLASGEVAAEVGTFRFDDLRLQLDTSVNTGVVHVTLRDSDSKQVLLETPVNASDHSRWFFTVAADRSLWFYSGDIGAYCWAPSPSGYSNVPLGSSTASPKNASAEFAKRMQQR